MTTKWLKRQVLGEGTFGTVFLAMPARDSSTMGHPLLAVKSAEFVKSSSLQKERDILRSLRGCPEIIHCYGDDLSIEHNKKEVYNLLLEYAPGGSLTNLIKNHGGKLPESDVRRYTHMILKGLCYIHDRGYVHCDIKPDNILVFPFQEDGTNYVKIADFGLAKRAGGEIYIDGTLNNFRGTPLYTSPESVYIGQNEAPMDIWALGCTIVEMISGKPAWSYEDKHELLYQIAFGEEVPEIPEGMSESGEDFLIRCLIREAGLRWTAEMLLNHPFMIEEINNINKPMPPQMKPCDYNLCFSKHSMFSAPSDCCFLDNSFRAETSFPPSLSASKLGWSEATLINHVFAGY